MGDSMTTDIKSNAVLTFGTASAIFTFATSLQNEAIFPRDRIFNLAVSVIINLLIIYLLSYIDLSKNAVSIVACIFIFYKLIINTVSFSKYFATFHRDNSEVIIFVTFVIILGCLKLTQNNILQMYSFFIVINIFTFILITTLSLGKINVINIYSTSLNIELIKSKFTFFDEIIIINLLVKDRIEKKKCAVSFLCIIGTIILFYTLLQGLCISGNILYSLLPLQSLTQIFSGTTIKKFDYIISVLQSFNYYAAIIFLMWGFNVLKSQKGEMSNEKV